MSEIYTIVAPDRNTADARLEDIADLLQSEPTVRRRDFFGKATFDIENTGGVIGNGSRAAKNDGSDIYVIIAEFG